LFEIKVFPNPVGDFFNIEIENPEFKKLNIELYNVNGQIIKSVTTNGTELKIERDGLPSGVYKLLISDGVTSQTKKILFK
jgi:hypothetical protein